MTESSFSSGFINDLLLSDNSAEYQLVSTTSHSCIYKTIYKGKILILKAARQHRPCGQCCLAAERISDTL